MAKTDFKSVDEYIATFPKDAQNILQTVRRVIRKAVPDAEEVISYQIPAFRSSGGWVFYLSAHTNHYSLACPPPFAVFTAFAKELARYEMSKSAIKFPKAEPVPEGLIGRMAKFQAAENRERAQKTTSTPAKAAKATKSVKATKAAPKNATTKKVTKTAAKKPASTKATSMKRAVKKAAGKKAATKKR